MSNKPTGNETTPATALRALTDHITRNPFATDRKTVMVGAVGRKLQTELQKLDSLRQTLKDAEAGLGGIVAEAMAVLNGTAVGLSAGPSGAKPSKSNGSTGEASNAAPVQS